jgi:hypothetical protein
MNPVRVPYFSETLPDFGRTHLIGYFITEVIYQVVTIRNFPGLEVYGIEELLCIHELTSQVQMDILIRSQWGEAVPTMCDGGIIMLMTYLTLPGV